MNRCRLSARTDRDIEALRSQIKKRYPVRGGRVCRGPDDKHPPAIFHDRGSERRNAIEFEPRNEGMAPVDFQHPFLWGHRSDPVQAVAFVRFRKI